MSVGVGRKAPPIALDQSVFRQAPICPQPAPQLGEIQTTAPLSILLMRSSSPARPMPSPAPLFLRIVVCGVLAVVTGLMLWRECRDVARRLCLHALDPLIIGFRGDTHRLSDVEFLGTETALLQIIIRRLADSMLLTKSSDGKVTSNIGGYHGL